jgi:voltage-gated sodium channel
MAERKLRELARVVEHGSFQKHRRLFEAADYQQQHMLETIDHRADGGDFYSEKGTCARLAQSKILTFISTLVVLLNTVWLGIDANYNDASSLYEADWIFGVVENLFCTFYLFELVIRIAAFKNKCNCFRDGWIIFDTSLLVLMAGEIWMIPLYFKALNSEYVDASSTAGRGGWAVLRCARLMKVLRLGRLAKVVRLFPELMSMCKAIFIATRSVFFTLLLLTILVYVFAIIFVTQLRGNEAITDELTDFKTMHGSMWVLTIEGVLLDGPKDSLNVLVKHSYVMTTVFLVFISLSSFTILNMLIGILCKVVDQVSQSEKDAADVKYLKSTLLELLESHDEDNDRRIRKDEFDVFIRNPVTRYVLTRFGVDAGDLLLMKDNLFDSMDTCMSKADVIRNDSDELMPLDSALSFGEFLRVVLRLRGGNAVRVTDMVDLREFMKKSMDTHREYMGQRLRLLEQEILGSRACPHEAPLSEHIDANTNNSAVSAMKQARDGTMGKRVVLVSENAQDVASPGAPNIPHVPNHVSSMEGAGHQQLLVSQQQTAQQFYEIQKQLSQMCRALLARHESDSEKYRLAWQEEVSAAQEQMSQQLLEVQKQLGQIFRVAGQGRGSNPVANLTAQSWCSHQSFEADVKFCDDIVKELVQSRENVKTAKTEDLP